MRLSACLIVRDEKYHLGQCLSRLKGVVDEIIVVDTGSIDTTVEIAKTYGARVYHKAWDNDFASVRNYGLDQARGDWILYIDADEYLSVDKAAFSILKDSNAVAGTVTFRPASHLTTYPEYRLFRNRPDIRFRGAIHETILPDIQRLCRRGSTVIEADDWTIEHWGYEGDLTPKHKRNHPMLNSAVQHDPGRIYLWHALAECEQGLGNFAAAEIALRRALALVRKHPGESINGLIYSDLMDLHFHSPEGGLQDVEKLTEEARQLHSDDPQVLWWLARYHLSTNTLGQCQQDLDKLAAFGPEGPYRGALAYDRRLFGEYQWSLRGSCALLQGDCSAAVDLLTLALTANPDNCEIVTKLALARGRLAVASQSLPL